MSLKKFKMNFVMAMIMVVCLFCGCGKRANDFSEQEHLRRISALVEERYMAENSEYTGYTIFPLYNEKEELSHFLVEFEPYGFVYIKVQEKDLSAFGGTSMYTREASEGESWKRYTVKENAGVTVEEEERIWETDENGAYIEYRDSHFKVANIVNEKRYFLEITQGGRTGFIPTVKKNDTYLNLVSMKEMTYEREIANEIHAVSSVRFIGKSYFDL